MPLESDDIVAVVISIIVSLAMYLGFFALVGLLWLLQWIFS